MAGQVRNAVRLASLLASDKMKGGPGLVPQIMPREGLDHGPQWRVFQLGANAAAGINNIDTTVTLFLYLTS